MQVRPRFVCSFLMVAVSVRRFLFLLGGQLEQLPSFSRTNGASCEWERRMARYLYRIPRAMCNNDYWMPVDDASKRR
jgi:hypothetical protein